MIDINLFAEHTPLIIETTFLFQYLLSIKQVLIFNRYKKSTNTP